MAKQLSFIQVDTPISGVTSNELAIELVNFGADFVEKTNSKKGEVIITNVKAPIAAPENFRYAVSDVTDVYGKSKIDPSYRALSKAGKSLLIQNTLVLKETDSTDPTYEALVPFEIHLVATYPTVESLTDALVLKVVRRFLAGLLLTGQNGPDRLVQILRGRLVPPDVK